MKIAYCTSSILISGGLERVLALKTNYLADVLGYEVTIITTDNGKGSPFFHFSSKIRFIDIGVPYQGHSFVSKVINRLSQRIKLRKRLRNVLNELKPDITISTFRNEASCLPDMKDGSIKIIENHNTRYYRLLRNENPIDRLVSKIRFYNDALIVKKYDAFVTLTEEDKNDWPANKNISFIPNPLTITCHKKAEFQGKRVISVGRITHQKGFDDLIKAWKLVEQKHPDWELLIIGLQDDSAYVNYLNNLIHQLGLKNVTMRAPTIAIEEEYLQSNILVMTSNYEGFGLVLTEGMSVGLPLVSFDCKCGPSDIIIDGENGFLIKDRNLENFAERVCLLIENKELHDSMSTKAIAMSKKYEIQNIMERWTSLFNKLLQSKK